MTSLPGRAPLWGCARAGSGLDRLPEGVSLRPARASEQAILRAIIRRARINPLGLNWQRFVVVADQQGSVVACGQVKPHRDGTRELASLAVVEAWQGKGLARAIIEHLQQVSGPPLWLTCRERLAPLYRRFGFQQVQRSADMSPYFRRLDRVAKTILRFARQGGGLAVMLWQESCT